MTTTPRTNLGGQFGFVKEDTWSVYKAPTKFLPTLGKPGITGGPEPENSESIIANRLHLDANQFATGNETYKGDIDFEVYDHATPALLEACLGTVATTGTNPYAHTITPGEPLPSYTVQWGVPGATAGTVLPRTYTGCKVESWEMAGEVGKIVTLGTSWSARNEILYRTVADGVLNTTTLVTSATAVFNADDVGKPISGTGIPPGATIASVTSATNIVLSAAATATATGVTLTIGVALASASYPSNLIPMRFKNGALSLFGTAVSVKSFSVKGDNKLTYDERRFAGSTRIGKEQVSQALREYGGDVLLEFDNGFTEYNRFKYGTQGALSLVLTVGSNTITITENIVYTGETPAADGMGIVDQKLPFMALGSTDAAAVTIVAVNADSAP